MRNARKNIVSFSHEALAKFVSSPASAFAQFHFSRPRKKSVGPKKIWGQLSSSLAYQGFFSRDSFVSYSRFDPKTQTSFAALDQFSLEQVQSEEKQCPRFESCFTHRAF